MTAEPTTDPREEELAALRARVAELEDELAQQAQTTAAALAQAQEKLYWLERWHIDLDRVMRKPGAVQALDALRGARRIAWALRRFKRRLLRRG